MQRPPEQGAGATLKAWQEYARFQGVPFELSDGRNDVIAKVKAAQSRGGGSPALEPEGDRPEAGTGAANPPAPAPAEPVTYLCSRTPGLVVHNPDRVPEITAQFVNGVYTTSDPREIAVLDQVAEVRRG
jgi:hypothetical protein